MKNRKSDRRNHQGPSPLDIELLVALYSQGRYGEAAILAQTMTVRFPRYGLGWKILGAALLRLGQSVSALAALKRAAALLPGDFRIHLDLGVVFLSEGRLDEAEASYRRALQIKPDDPVSFNNLGNILKRQGRLDEAEGCFRRALQIKPDDPVALINLGNTLQAQSRLDEAEASYRRALEINPDNSVALINLGVTFQAQRRLDAAEASFRQALQIKPDEPGVLINLGATLQLQGRVDAAESSYRSVVELQPDNPDGHINLANILQAKGRLGEAKAHFLHAMALKPDQAEYHRNLSLQKTYSEDDPDIHLIEEIYRKSNRLSNNRIHACFALGKAYEDIGQYEASFQMYAEGNRLRKKVLYYDLERDRALFAAIRSAYVSEPVISIKDRPIDSVPRFVFIVGMPRSGTSLVEQILSSHPLVFGAGELESMEIAVRAEFNPHGKGDCFNRSDAAINRIRENYLAAIQKLNASRSVITDKMPLNFRWIGFILDAFPDARVVHLNRHPVAVCWSVYKSYFPATDLNFAWDLKDLAGFYGLYRNLMQFWREKFLDRIYDLDYEGLTENQKGETRKLLDYCGLPWDDRCLDFHRTDRAVRTASMVQVRHGLYTGSSQAWRKFEKNLGPLIEDLEGQN